MRCGPEDAGERGVCHRLCCGVWGLGDWRALWPLSGFEQAHLSRWVGGGQVLGGPWRGRFQLHPYSV